MIINVICKILVILFEDQLIDVQQYGILNTNLIMLQESEPFLPKMGR